MCSLLRLDAFIYSPLLRLDTFIYSHQLFHLQSSVCRTKHMQNSCVAALVEPEGPGADVHGRAPRRGRGPRGAARLAGRRRVGAGRPRVRGAVAAFFVRRFILDGVLPRP